MRKRSEGKDSLRKAAERQLAHAPIAIAASAEKLLHELQVHQFELELMNESLLQSQIALNESRDRYVDLYEFAPVAYLTLEHTGLITQVNLAAAVLLGLGKQQLLQRRFAQFIAPVDRVQWQRRFMGLIQQQGGAMTELALQREDGSLLYVLVNSFGVTAKDGHPSLKIALTDVTRQREIGVLLRESEMRWQFAVESHGDAMWDWDAEKDELFLTSTARALFNLPDTGSARPFSDLLAQVASADRALVLGQINDILQGATAEWLWECRFSKHQEDPRWIATRGRVMTRGADGRPRRIVSISSDVTQQKARQDEARRQRALVAQQARLVLLGELASALAHEINQPLTAITGFSAACARKVAELPDVLELVRAIESQAMRVGEIAWRMRGFARRQSQGRSALSLRDVVADVVKWIRVDSIFSNAVIDIAGIDANLPMVSADKVELEQVLLNLVRNGIEASLPKISESPILIAACMGAKSDEIEVSVTDSGRGLPKTPDFEVFKPFMSTKDQGLGLGLTICHSIIEGHGGHLWATPNPAGGTIFRFTLPIAKPAASGDDGHANRSAFS